MADFAAVVQALRDVCRGTAGSTRVVDVGELAEGAYEQTPEHEAARSLALPTFEVEFTDVGRAREALSEHGNISLLDITVQIRTTWTTEHELLEDERASARATALELLEDVRAALMRAGNLPSTLGADVSLVSGCLHRHLGHRLERADWPRRRFSYLSRFTTVAQVTQTPG